MAYVDGFVVPVPTGRRDDYRIMAEKSVALFKEYGALKMAECWGDDVPQGKLTSFPMAVKAEAGETVVFSWIWWPSKAVRDAGMKTMMDDPRMKELGEMPFDGRRMIFGGFEVLLYADMAAARKEPA